MAIYNYFILSFLLGGITCYFTGILAYLKNRKGALNRYFFALSFCSGTWSIGHFVMAITDNYNLAWTFCRILYVAAILIPSLYMFFIFSFIEEVKRRKNEIFLSFLTSLAFLFLIFNKQFIKGIVPKSGFKYYDTLGSLGLFFMLFFAFVTIYSLKRLFSALKRYNGSKLMQLKYVMLGSIFGFIGGGSTFFLAFNIPIPPFPIILFSLYPIAVTYAVIKYRFLEIEIVVRKTIVFAGLFTFVFAAFVGTAYLAQTYWTQIIGSEYLAMAIAVLIIVLVQEPLKNMLIKYTDRFLLQKKYDYQKVLRDASEGMAMVRESKWLLGLMTHIVSSKMRVSNIGIFLQDEEITDNYFLKARRGEESIQLTSLSKDNPICLWLKENKKPLVFEEVDYLLQRKDSSTSNSSIKNILTRVKSQMQSLNSKVVIPAFYKGSLLGFLTLGYKLSGDIYTKDDLTLLSTLSSAAAVAIENARLFDSLIDEMEINNQLRKEEEESYLQMMMSLAKTIDAKDSYTYDHVEMVFQYGVDLGEYLPGVNKDALKASLRLHDLGKIGVPDSILSKPGPLTPEEWKKVKDHTILGARILAPLKRFEYVAKIILHHQEKFDGTGYPAGLKGEDIPLESRIISVVDAYHAMISDRPYRKALSKETAVAELKKFAGTQFDPAVVEAFLRLLKEKYGITGTL